MQCTNPVLIRNKDYAFEKGMTPGLFVPCGKCMSCRIARSREWATRILHESTTSKESVFITLTYNDELLGSNSLNKIELINFMRRLKRYFSDKKLRYFACGEYGEVTFRKHYHSIVFGIGINDLDCYKPTSKIIASRLLEKLWQNGNNVVGTVTYDSARYVSDYVLKKYTGKKEKEVYTDLGLETPFQIMSKGIGLDYLNENEDYFRQKIGCTVRGKEVGLPRYYKKKLDIPTEVLYEKSLIADDKLSEVWHKRGIKKDLIGRESYIEGQKVIARKQHDKNIKARKDLYKKTIV